MSACTCTNTLYERVRPPTTPPYQSKSDHQSAYTINQNPTAPTTARTSRNPSSCTVRNQTGTMSGEKLAFCPEQTCHYPRFWPDSHCLKTCNRRLTCHLASMQPNSRTPFPPFACGHLPSNCFQPLTVRQPHPEHLPANCFTTSTYHRTTASRALYPWAQTNLIPGPKLTCLPQKQHTALSESFPFRRSQLDQPVASCSVHRSQLGSPYRPHPQSFS